MAVTTDNVPNENYEPGEREETILELLKEGRDEGEPWGRVNPKFVTDRTEMRRQYVSRALGNLETAGWVKKISTGLYELVEDPRDDHTSTGKVICPECGRHLEEGAEDDRGEYFCASCNVLWPEDDVSRLG